MENLDRDRRLFRFWLMEGRLTTALTIGAVPAIVVYNLTGWHVVSFVIGALLAVGALALIATYAPR